MEIFFLKNNDKKISFFFEWEESVKIQFILVYVRVCVRNESIMKILFIVDWSQFNGDLN